MPPSNNEEYKELLSVADPEGEGTITYASFVAIAALKLNARGEQEENKEVKEGFELFLRMGEAPDGGPPLGEPKITMAMLKRIAGLLKEDVKDEVLRDMMLEANGGAGIGKGVDLQEFEGVMRQGQCFLLLFGTRD